MAKRITESKKEKGFVKVSSDKRFLLSFLAGILAVCLLLAMAFYNPEDLHIVETTPEQTGDKLEE